jgi:dTDP-4-dehydrorhamnose 3,5-epimerase
VKFTPTPLPGVVIVEQEPVHDHRGSFARMWCEREFKQAGLDGRFVQSSLSMSQRKHTVRGLHWAALPSRETKLVRVVAGAIFDVVVDLREDSSAYGEIFTIKLDAASAVSLAIPPQCAHGFQTLVDATEVLYCMTEAYEPSVARTWHWRSAELGIPWPYAGPDVTLSTADAQAAAFERHRPVGSHRSGDRPR